MRIWIRGSTGSGKSTLAAELAERFDLELIELDDLWWLPGWKERSVDEFAQLVDRATQTDHWVVCGNYRAVADRFVLSRCDTVIWLDYPFWLIMGRLLRRTYRRVFKGELCCNGNRERLWIHLTPKGLPWWLIATYRRRRRQCDQMMEDPNLSHLVRIRVRRPRDLDRELSELVKALAGTT